MSKAMEQERVLVSPRVPVEQVRAEDQEAKRAERRSAPTQKLRWHRIGVKGRFAFSEDGLDKSAIVYAFDDSEQMNIPCGCQFTNVGSAVGVAEHDASQRKKGRFLELQRVRTSSKGGCTLIMGDVERISDCAQRHSEISVLDKNGAVFPVPSMRLAASESRYRYICEPVLCRFIARTPHFPSSTRILAPR
jgi:hypothetical protein